MSETVTASHVFLGNTATSVDEVLLFLSEKAVELGITDDVESTLEAFKNREAEGTTGMMGGFAAGWRRPPAAALPRGRPGHGRALQGRRPGLR